jgi:hypothetical protein
MRRAAGGASGALPPVAVWHLPGMLDDLFPLPFSLLYYLRELAAVWCLAGSRYCPVTMFCLRFISPDYYVPGCGSTPVISGDCWHSCVAFFVAWRDITAVNGFLAFLCPRASDDVLVRGFCSLSTFSD